MIHASWFSDLQVEEGELNNKRVNGKRHKTDLNAPILRFTLLHQYLEFLIVPLHPDPFQKCSGLIFHMLIIARVTCTAVSSFFCLVPTQKTLSLDRALIFQINLGIPSKTSCHNLIYYYLYHE